MSWSVSEIRQLVDEACRQVFGRVPIPEKPPLGRIPTGIRRGCCPHGIEWGDVRGGDCPLCQRLLYGYGTPIEEILCRCARPVLVSRPHRETSWWRCDTCDGLVPETDLVDGAAFLHG